MKRCAGHPQRQMAPLAAIAIATLTLALPTAGAPRESAPLKRAGSPAPSFSSAFSIDARLAGPTARFRCGAYSVQVKNGEVSVSKPGGMVKRVRGLKMRAGCLGDITGDAIPELLVRDEWDYWVERAFWQGNGRTDSIFSLGSTISVLLVFLGRHGGLKEVRNFDREGPPELLAEDDSFAYLTFPDSSRRALEYPSLLFVLCLQGGRYQDCSRKYPRLLGEDLARAAAGLGQALAIENPWKRIEAAKRAVLAVLANATLLDREEDVFRGLNRTLPQDVVRWLAEQRQRIAEVVARRGRKITYAEPILTAAEMLERADNLDRADRGEEALGAMRQALAMAQQVADRPTEARALAWRAAQLADKGRASTARDDIMKALAIYRELGDQEAEYRELNTAEHVFVGLGLLPEARAALLRKLDLIKTLERPREMASTLRQLATVYHRLGDDLQAHELLQRAFAIHHDNKNDLEQASVALEISHILQEMEQPALAREWIRYALNMYRFVESTDSGLAYIARMGKVSSLTRLANLELSLGRSTEALGALGTAQVESRYWWERPVILASKGEVLLALHQYAEALQLYTELSRTVSRPSEWPDLVWVAAHGRGRALEGLGRSREAARSYQHTIGILEEMRSAAGGAEERVGFFRSVTDVYDDLTALLVQGAARGKADPAEALRAAEQSRARGLVDLLDEARARATAGLNNEERQLLLQEGDLRQELTATRSRWRRELAKSPEERHQGLLETLEGRRLRLEVELRKVQDALAARNARYGTLARQSPNIAVVQKALRPGEVILEYFLTDRLAAVWVVRPDRPVGLHVLPMPGGSIGAHVSKIREQLRTPGRAVPIPLPTPQQQGPEGIDLALAHRLYRVLVAPVEGEIRRARTVFVVPHRSLFALPFEALVRSAKDPSGKAIDLAAPLPSNQEVVPEYLGDVYTFAYLQSASVLALLRKNWTAAATSHRDLLVVADPVYDAVDSDGRGLQENQGADLPRGALRSPAAGLRGFRVLRLPFTAQEARDIGTLFGATEWTGDRLGDVISRLRAWVHRLFGGGAGGDVFLRRRAQESLVKELDLTRYRYIHFATHGLLADEVQGALQPSLVLSLVGDPKDDGFLEMDEVLNLRLNADMVTLSACQTGLGTEVKGEGLVGLTRAFMYAGTPTVVVSLWNVSDPATAVLMTAFYQGLKAGQPKGEALRAAKRTLRKQGYKDATGQVHSGASPYLWAPFILVGDPN